MLRAVLWDVDGTLAETERDGHRVAFNRAFEAHGLPWRWSVDAYGRLLEIAGGLERLRYDLATRVDAPTSDDARDALARRLHATKNEAYAAIVATGAVTLRPGVRRLLNACASEGIAGAIATTTSRANVDALLAATLGADAAGRFATLVCAEDAPCKKPDPSVYRIALERLGFAATDAIAIEDSPHGVAAARAAGVAVLVTRSAYFAKEKFGEATACCDDLDSVVSWNGGHAPRVDVDVLRRLVTRAEHA